MEKYGTGRGLCRVTDAILAIAIPYLYVCNYRADIDCSVKSRWIYEFWNGLRVALLLSELSIWGQHILDTNCIHPYHHNLDYEWLRLYHHILGIEWLRLYHRVLDTKWIHPYHHILDSEWLRRYHNVSDTDWLHPYRHVLDTGWLHHFLCLLCILLLHKYADDDPLRPLVSWSINFPLSRLF